MSNEKFSNEQLVVWIQTGKDKDGTLMLQLWEQNRGFLAMMANKYKGAAEFDDLMQEGYLGLCAAVDHWEPDKGVVFIAYAGFWIKQAMSRYIESNSSMSCKMYQAVRKYRKFVSGFEQTYGRAPATTESCYFLRVDEKRLGSITEAAYRLQVASLDSNVGEDESCCLGDLVADDMDVETAVLEEVQQEQLKAVLWPMVDSLPEKQAAVIRMHYEKGMTLKAAGEHLGISHQGAREHERNGFRELRRYHNSRRLRPFLPETEAAAIYHGSGVEAFNWTWTSSTERVALRL